MLSRMKRTEPSASATLIPPMWADWRGSIRSAVASGVREGGILANLVAHRGQVEDPRVARIGIGKAHCEPVAAGTAAICLGAIGQRTLVGLLTNHDGVRCAIGDVRQADWLLENQRTTSGNHPRAIGRAGKRGRVIDAAGDASVVRDEDPETSRVHGMGRERAGWALPHGNDVAVDDRFVVAIGFTKTGVLPPTSGPILSAAFLAGLIEFIVEGSLFQECQRGSPPRVAVHI